MPKKTRVEGRIIVGSQDYDLGEHCRRFAIWSASIAASRSPKCRFKVKKGKEMIEAVAELYKLAEGPELLPEKDCAKQKHKEWREKLIKEAQTKIGKGPGREFTHGVAAKLINVYLKSLFLSSNIMPIPHKYRSKIDALHPPIDRLLLEKLGKVKCKDFSQPHYKKQTTWNSFKRRGWSKMGSDEYEAVIEAIGKITDGKLWKIERFWTGHQE